MKEQTSQNLKKKAQKLIFSIIATDVVLWTIRENDLLVRLIPVNIPPFFKEMSGLPGGLIMPTETAQDTAKRLIRDKAGVQTDKVYLEQLSTFSGIDRDPRGRVVAVAYSGYVPWEKLSTTERENTDLVWWANVAKLPKLAYDHQQIVAEALARLQSRATYTNLIAHLVPDKFTLTELQTAYESILKQELDKRNFRKKILGLGILKELSESKIGEKHRPAKMYSFNSLKVKEVNIL